MELKVEKIENGTVIDHIPSGQGLKVLEILGLNSNDSGFRVALLMNVASSRHQTKDIVKIAGRQIAESEVNKIALLAPNATLNIINNGEVVEKAVVKLPETVKGAAKCPNPQCITNNEPVSSWFQKEGDRYRCHYCEKQFEVPELASTAR